MENEKIRPDEGGAGATHEARGLAHDDKASHQCALLQINKRMFTILLGVNRLISVYK